jgi:SNF2 family DNA or RNA helicase
MFERDLLPCSTTLVIVPDALLEHWAEQIREHLKLESFVDRGTNDEDGGGNRGVVYIDGVGDLSTARFPLNYGRISLPSEFDLSDYMIVVVPFVRIKQEYLRAMNGKKRRRDDDDFDLSPNGESCASSSPLLQLRWFRIVVDEGHELGEQLLQYHPTNLPVAT